MPLQEHGGGTEQHCDHIHLHIDKQLSTCGHAQAFIRACAFAYGMYVLFRARLYQESTLRSQYPLVKEYTLNHNIKPPII